MAENVPTPGFGFITQRCIIAKSMFLAASVSLCVCLWVCSFVNMITSNRGMMKLGGRCIVQKSRPSSNFGVIDPGCAPPKNVALGYDVEKISAGCLVMCTFAPMSWLLFQLFVSVV